MPNFPIVDTHVHLWDPAHLRYPWLADSELLNTPHLPEDFRKACGPVTVERIVFVQCECAAEQCVEEATWVSSLSRQDARIQGIVAQASLESGDAIRPTLQALATNPQVKGVRRLIQSESVDFCLQPDFIRGVQLLPEYGLSFDICIYHSHLANILEFVRQCPSVSFILDHIGKPNIKERTVEPWKTELKALAAFPNVTVKMSGLITEADLERWKKEDLKPYIDHVIDCFGVERVVYGGDWPVSRLAGDYPDWVEALDWAIQDLPDVDKRKLYRDNAIAFYRLDG